MDINKLMLLEDSIIRTTTEIDNIVDTYGIYNSYNTEMISIGDITGHCAAKGIGTNLFNTLGDFYDADGNSYKSRSCDLLEVPNENIVETIKNTLSSESIVVNSIYGNNITGSGLHRYAVLRAHFLNESYGFEKGTYEHDEIKKKYTIPVNVRKVDIIKTYANYLISRLGYVLRSEFDSVYNYTGRVIIELSQDKKIVLNDKELILFTRNEVLKNIQIEDTLIINIKQERNKKFAEFIDTYIPELSIKTKQSKNEGVTL